MRTTHTIAAVYPLAGSEDGLPVEIRFTYEPRERMLPDIRYAGVAWQDGLSRAVRDAINDWARDWLDNDPGYARAWDVAADDTERQRESARDMGMIRS